jgi:hypothetical protein
VGWWVRGEGPSAFERRHAPGCTLNMIARHLHKGHLWVPHQSRVEAATSTAITAHPCRRYNHGLTEGGG